MLLSAIGLLVLFITILLSQLLAKSLVRPIRQLADYADEAGKGNFGAPVPVKASAPVCSNSFAPIMPRSWQLMWRRWLVLRILCISVNVLKNSLGWRLQSIWGVLNFRKYRFNKNAQKYGNV